MLPPAHRMRRGADFTQTTRQGTKVSRGRVVCYVYRPADEVGPGLAGLIVGKIVGNSVARHRASRRIRACLAPVIRGLPEGTRVVVRALAGADSDPGLCRDVTSAIHGALERQSARQSG